MRPCLSVFLRVCRCPGRPFATPYTMTTARFCHGCGRLAMPGAAFCPHCGVRLGQRPVRSSAAATGRATAPPDAAELVGECAVVAPRLNEEAIRAVGRLVAAATGRPLPDVTRDIRDSRGVLARGLAKEHAVELVGKLREASVEAVALGEGAFVPLPQVQRMRGLSVGEEGISCEAYTWDSTRTLEAPWERVFLVAAGRLRVTEVVEVEKPLPKRRLGIMASQIDKRIPQLETRVRFENILDVVLFEPWERLRLDENPAAYALAGSERDEHAAIQEAATLLYATAHDAPCDAGLELMATRAPEEAWASCTFESKAEFDAYVEWLVQLVRYGLEMPK